MAQLKTFVSITSWNADNQAPNKRVLQWQQYLLGKLIIYLTYPEHKPFNQLAYLALSLFKPLFTLNLILNDTGARTDMCVKNAVIITAISVEYSTNAEEHAPNLHERQVHVLVQQNT